MIGSASLRRVGCVHSSEERDAGDGAQLSVFAGESSVITRIVGNPCVDFDALRYTGRAHGRLLQLFVRAYYACTKVFFVFTV